jgi:outer membrane protein assembly factor BamB
MSAASHRRKDVIYLGANGQVVAIDTRTGEPLWETPLKTGWIKTGNGFVSLQEDGPYVYAFSYGIFHVLRASDGEVLCRGPVIKALKNHAGVFAQEPSSGGTAFIGDGDGSGDGSGDGGGGDGGGGGD